jgi:amino acid adenylation domain-containing protein
MELDMSQLPSPTPSVLAQQQAIRDACVHPTGTFIAFSPEAIEQSIPARFEQQVARYPERLAVKSRHQALTYTALNQMANRVARAILARCGVGAEPIALLLEQGAPAIAALLGILKAGKFYVPMDPTYPPARLAYMFEDSQARLIVTYTQHLPLTEAVGRHGPEVLNLDELDAEIVDENLGMALSSDTLAYLLYTSGSTGAPKGVLQNHRNVLHMIKNECNGFHFCADDRLSLLYSPSFVGAVRNTFSALLNGAAVFPFNLREEGLARLASWLVQEEITFYNSVATVFRHFAGTLTGQESFPHLRLILVGSETVYRSDVELYRKHFPASCLFVVGMGATEITHIRHYFVDQHVSITDDILPIGYPEEGVQVLLLDQANQDVGIDAVGQIAVKSRYLSLGYWRRPDLTRARFLPDPNGSDERMYLTGDLGRMHADGCLIHLGREDFQVKIRGHRVEIVEIETALLNHPGVKEAVVVAHDDPRGETRLTAYLVASQEAVPSPGELRNSLAVKLPDYMQPTAFRFLDALPLTPTGKVDRGALPAPETHRQESEAAYVPPRTDVERALTAIWQEVLQIDRVSLNDNFFDLGGHSLLLAQVYNKLQGLYSQNLSMTDMFAHPTIKTLSTYLSEKVHEPADALQHEDSMEQLNAGRNRLQRLHQRRQQGIEHEEVAEDE